MRRSHVLQVLPEHVPSPLRSFTWEDMREIEVSDMIQQLHHASWLLSDAYPRLSPEATSNASREDLEWAISVSAPLAVKHSKVSPDLSVGQLFKCTSCVVVVVLTEWNV